MVNATDYEKILRAKKPTTPSQDARGVASVPKEIPAVRQLEDHAGNRSSGVREGGFVNIEVETAPCIVCEKRSVLTVDQSNFVAWRRGTLIQNAFPHMPAGDRELLMTGTHEACWDDMFPADEDDD